MDSTAYDKRKTFVVACLFVFVSSCAGASIKPELPPPTAGNSSHLILDTDDLDLNKDGCIGGEEELEAFKQHVMDALAGTRNSILKAHSIVHRTDVNRDGKICWCDFISIYLHEKASRGKHSVPFVVLPDTVMFTQLDKDNDGQLAGDEKEKLVQEFESCLPHSQAQSIISALTDELKKDDAISREEFQEFFNAPKELIKPHISSPPSGDKKDKP
jgi:Ca2+-binding EF-hand superfamily protein